MQNFNVDFVPIKRLKGIFKTRAMILKKNIFQIRFRLYRKKFIQTISMIISLISFVKIS